MGCETLQYNAWVRKSLKKDATFIYTLKLQVEEFHPNIHCMRTHSMNIDNSSIERVEEFKYLGTPLINQKSIQEEIKSRLKLGNACYNSVQNLLSSRLLSKHLKIKIC